MKLDVAFTYSTMVRVRSVKGGARRGDVRASLPVIVAERDVADCPVAVVLGNGTEYRGMGGRLASRVPLPAGVTDLKAWMREAAREGDRELPLCEFTVSRLPMEDDPRLSVRTDCDERRQKVARLEEAAADLSIVDGGLWRVDSDPVLAVSLGREGPVVEVVTNGPSAATRFRLDQREVAEAFVRRTFPGVPVPLPDYRLLDPACLTLDAQGEGLAHVGRRYANHLRETVGQRDYRTLTLYGRVRELVEVGRDPVEPDLGRSAALRLLLPELRTAVPAGLEQYDEHARHAYLNYDLAEDAARRATLEDEEAAAAFAP